MNLEFHYYKVGDFMESENYLEDFNFKLKDIEFSKTFDFLMNN